MSVMGYFVDELLALDDLTVRECDTALEAINRAHDKGELAGEEADRLAESVRTRRHIIEPLADFAW